MFIKNLKLFAKGLLMGVANKVPGVSGGAVAYILGFYNELIYSFQKFNGKAVKLFFSGRFKSLYQYLNLSFLTYVIGGTIFSYFTVSKLLDFLLEKAELYIWSLFFGMIIGSVIYIYRKHPKWNAQNYCLGILGVLIGVAISFIDPAKGNTNLWFIFLCGIVGVSGMTIPGLSGSFILMLMGNYVLLLVDSVNVLNQIIWKLFGGDISVLQNEQNQFYLRIILVFTLGSLFGLFSLSQLLGYLLKKWEHNINSLIIGFILGSLGTVWPWKEKILATNSLGEILYDGVGSPVLMNYQRYIPNWFASSNLIALGIIFLGVIIVLSIERFSQKKVT